MNQPKLINQIKANVSAPKFKKPYAEIDYNARLTKLEAEIKFLRAELAKSKKQ